MALRKVVITVSVWLCLWWSTCCCSVQSMTDDNSSRADCHQPLVNLRSGCVPRLPPQVHYYFNSNEICKEFSFFNCQGNSNDFSTIEECEFHCVHQPPSTTESATSSVDNDTFILSSNDHSSEELITTMHEDSTTSPHSYVLPPITKDAPTTPDSTSPFITQEETPLDSTSLKETFPNTQFQENTPSISHEDYSSSDEVTPTIDEALKTTLSSDEVTPTVDEAPKTTLSKENVFNRSSELGLDVYGSISIGISVVVVVLVCVCIALAAAVLSLRLKLHHRQQKIMGEEQQTAINFIGSGLGQHSPHFHDRIKDIDNEKNCH